MEIILLAINQLNTAFNFTATGLLILTKEYRPSSVSIVKKSGNLEGVGNVWYSQMRRNFLIYDAFPYRIKNFPFFTEFAHNLFLF
jgi:hypothetical protein